MKNERPPYDFLIVGAGLYGAVFSYMLHRAGKKCLVIDKRNHIGGNVYCENIDGITVHKYGPHIFHTNNEEVWKFVNSHVEFKQFVYAPVANYKGRLYNLPFNMNTFYQLWKTITPEQAQKIIERQTRKYKGIEIKNLEDQALSTIGFELYEKFLKGYSEKQWGRDAREIPAFIAKRIPIRYDFDNNYFNDKYQGIPMGGYNTLVKNLLSGIEIRLNVDFFSEKDYFEQISHKILYTGKIDEFFSYQLGHLDYRSLKFETEVLDVKNFQGNAAINYTHRDIPFTRIIEHKHFERGNQENTVITREYPASLTKENDPYYPINDDQNNCRYNQYREMASLCRQYLFGGRLADYKYYNMDEIISVALQRVRKQLEEMEFMAG